MCVLSLVGSLSALVYQHSITPISLPCALRIPEKGKQNATRQQHAEISLNDESTDTTCAHCGDRVYEEL